MFSGSLFQKSITLRTLEKSYPIIFPKLYEELTIIVGFKFMRNYDFSFHLTSFFLI